MPSFISGWSSVSLAKYLFMFICLPWFGSTIYQSFPSLQFPFMNNLHAADKIEMVELLHGVNPQWVVIWLHGLGADGNDFVPIVPDLGLPESVSVKFLFPHAPVRPITINGGMQMRGWYDIKSMDLINREDEAGVLESEQIVQGIIEQQIGQGIPAENIILAGFSQGGAIALHAGLRSQHRLAGVIALSTYIPMINTFADNLSAANTETPIFMAHGESDPVVSAELGLKSKNLLEKLGYGVEWNTYPMPHSVSAEEITAIGHWLKNRFNAN
ncbi:MAG: phospholipase/carboxylesterase [Gammaproteobacteria bacterium]